MLLGREVELARIEAVLSRARSGHGAVAALAGPPGIGKTTLLSAAARRARSWGFSVLQATGAELEREYAFGVVRQLFAPIVSEGRWSGNRLQGAAALAAVPLGVPSGRADPSVTTADAVTAAMHGLYWLTADLAAEGPLVLVLDDAQWADTMSWRFVLYLGRRLEDLPVAVLTAARPAAHPSEREQLAQMAALPGVVALDVAPLGPGDVGRVVEESGLTDADDSFIAACHGASGGNPFLLGELLAGLRASGATGTAADAALVAGFAPQGIVRWASARLVSLGTNAEQLALAYAVLGGSPPLSDAAALAALDPAAAAQAADALIAAHVLTDERPYKFVHPLLQAAVYEGLSPAKCADAHARAARLIAERGTGFASIAAHLLAADPGRDSWAIEVLRAAAREASASGAAASAATYLERAVQEAPPPAVRGELLLDLGEARLQAGLGGAIDRMEEALDLCPEGHRRAEISLRLGRALFSAGADAAAREAFARGLTEGLDVEDDLLLELRGWYIAVAREDPGLPEAARARLRVRVHALVEDDAPGATRTDRALLAVLALQSALSGRRSHEQVARLARRALADGALLRDSGTDMGAYGSACHALRIAGEPDAAIDELDRAIELSQRQGWRVAFGWFSLFRGSAHYARGNLIAAIADLESARQAHTAEYARGQPVNGAWLALCLLERDDLPHAVEALELPGEMELSGAQPLISYHYARARLETARGRLSHAVAALIECERCARRMREPNPAANLPWRSDMARLYSSLGESDRAAELIAEDVMLARQFGAPHALGIALRAAGLIQGGGTGLQHLIEAVELLDNSGFELELARTLTAQGAALRRAGRRRDAQEALRRGLDIAARCGALALATEAREELRLAGARPRRERVSGTDALTASELRVARMAAAGMTNRAIAQALFITLRTVETHLTSIYRKLDIAGRERLSEALQRTTPIGRPSVTVTSAGR